MPTKKIGNPSPKSSAVPGKTAPAGLRTMHTQGAPHSIGTNPNKGRTEEGNMSGLRGGMPGVRPANGGGTQRVRDVAYGVGGSGHDKAATKRSSHTGYGNVHKSLKGRVC